MYRLKIQEKFQDEIQNKLVKRLDLLLYDTYHLISKVERLTIRGNCNEIELILLENFRFTQDQIILIEQKVYRFYRFCVGKYGGYVLTQDRDGNYIWKKHGQVVNPDFRKPDNGIGDTEAMEATRDFRKWIKETGITSIDWMVNADVIYPAIKEVEEYTLDFLNFDSNI